MITPREELHALNDGTYEEAGKFLRVERELIGWSRKQVAEIMKQHGWNEFIVENIELGKYGFSMIQQYAEALGFECNPYFSKFLDPTTGERVTDWSFHAIVHDAGYTAPEDDGYFVDVDIVGTRKVESRTVQE